MAGLLTEEEISRRLLEVPGWKLEGREILRTFKFEDFKGAIGFVNAVAALAEDAGHHPDIDIRWNKVLLRLCTHSKGGLTANDFDLASQISALNV